MKSVLRNPLLRLSTVLLFSFHPGFCSFAAALPALDDPKIEKLKTQKISVAGFTINAEIADTPDARERGLMYRKSMPSQGGMLFIFESAQPLAFWMKNTLIPLSIGYFDQNRKLLGTFEMTPAVMGEMQPKTYPSGGAALYALEMNKGWFTSHHIKIGAELKLPTKTVVTTPMKTPMKTPANP